PPRLCWSRTFASQTFGHYDRVADTVMISASLDSRRVPLYVVDFVVYHELLHRKLAGEWRRGRKIDHTSRFRHEERLFGRYEPADAFLKKLARAR
ncbi:hypothetical protein LCGC14_2373070, partial [marine sediment metagenome]